MRGSVAALPVWLPLVFCVASAAAQSRGPFSGWTLSASDSDPFANVIPATLDTVSVYVWLWCADPPTPEAEGISAAYFHLFEFNRISEVQVRPGVTDANPDPNIFDLTLQGCPAGASVVAQFRYVNLSVPEYNICPLDDGYAVACEETAQYPLAWIGLGVGQAACVIDGFFFEGWACSPPSAVVPTTWGRVKENYKVP